MTRVDFVCGVMLVGATVGVFLIEASKWWRKAREISDRLDRLEALQATELKAYRDALEVLRSVQWSGTYYDEEGVGDLVPYCPVCENPERSGHKPGCRLAAAAGLDTEAPK